MQSTSILLYTQHQTEKENLLKVLLGKGAHLGSQSVSRNCTHIQLTHIVDLNLITFLPPSVLAITIYPSFLERFQDPRNQEKIQLLLSLLPSTIKWLVYASNNSLDEDQLKYISSMAHFLRGIKPHISIFKANFFPHGKIGLSRFVFKQASLTTERKITEIDDEATDEEEEEEITKLSQIKAEPHTTIPVVGVTKLTDEENFKQILHSAHYLTFDQNTTKSTPIPLTPAICLSNSFFLQDRESTREICSHIPSSVQWLFCYRVSVNSMNAILDAIPPHLTVYSVLVNRSTYFETKLLRPPSVTTSSLNSLSVQIRAEEADKKEISAVLKGKAMHIRHFFNNEHMKKRDRSYAVVHSLSSTCLQALNKLSPTISAIILRGSWESNQHSLWGKFFTLLPSSVKWLLCDSSEVNAIEKYLEIIPSHISIYACNFPRQPQSKGTDYSLESAIHLRRNIVAQEIVLDDEESEEPLASSSRAKRKHPTFFDETTKHSRLPEQVQKVTAEKKRKSNTVT